MSNYEFIFSPIDFYHLPRISDFLHPILMNVIDLGNLAAFIPFGILIPLLYRVNFIRFFLLFFLSILVIETIQALTFLRSFDINDAIQNSLGAATGFGAYKLGLRTKNIYRNMISIGIFYGLPDDSDDGILIISVGGQVVYTSQQSSEDAEWEPERAPSMFQFPMEPSSKITATIEGIVKIWDVGIR